MPSRQGPSRVTQGPSRGAQGVSPTYSPQTTTYSPQPLQHRVIEDLRWASLLSERPSCIPASRPKGAKAAGLRFEKALSRHLSGSLHGKWFEFEDRNGHGYCQTDIIYVFHTPITPYAVIIEVKYTLVPGAHTKLQHLYLPIVSAALRMPSVGVVAVKNLDPRFRRGRIYTDLPSAVQAACTNSFPSLIQWSGQALLPSQQSAKPLAQSQSRRIKAA